jgi:hypothetical protein
MQSNAGQPRSNRPESTRPLERLGGAAGLVFACGVALQNAVLLSGNPLPGASIDDIRSFYVDGQGRIAVGVGLVAVNVACLLLFSSAAADRLHVDPSSRIAGRAGFGATVLLAGAFLTTTMLQAVLTARVDSLATGGDLQLIWDLHTAAFAMSASSLAIVLLAFSLGSLISERLVPRWTSLVGIVGAAALLVAGVLVVSTVDGGPGIYAQLIGFIAWLVFLVIASTRLLRNS